MNPAEKSLTQFGMSDKETMNLAFCACVSSAGHCFQESDRGWMQYFRFFRFPTTQPTAVMITGRSPTLVTSKHT